MRGRLLPGQNQAGLGSSVSTLRNFNDFFGYFGLICSTDFGVACATNFGPKCAT